MPLIPASSQVSNGADATHVLHEDDSGHTKCRGYGNIEPPIAIEIYRVTPIQSDTLCIIITLQYVNLKTLYLSTDDVHWNFGPIFTGIENLLSLKHGLIKSFHFNFSENLM